MRTGWRLLKEFGKIQKESSVAFFDNTKILYVKKFEESIYSSLILYNLEDESWVKVHEGNYLASGFDNRGSPKYFWYTSDNLTYFFFEIKKNDCLIERTQISFQESHSRENLIPIFGRERSEVFYDYVRFDDQRIYSLINSLTYYYQFNGNIYEDKFLTFQDSNMRRFLFSEKEGTFNTEEIMLIPDSIRNYKNGYAILSCDETFLKITSHLGNFNFVSGMLDKLFQQDKYEEGFFTINEKRILVFISEGIVYQYDLNKQDYIHAEVFANNLPAISPKGDMVFVLDIDVLKIYKFGRIPFPFLKDNLLPKFNSPRGDYLSVSDHTGAMKYFDGNFLANFSRLISNLRNEGFFTFGFFLEKNTVEEFSKFWEDYFDGKDIDEYLFDYLDII